MVVACNEGDTMTKISLHHRQPRSFVRQMKVDKMLPECGLVWWLVDGGGHHHYSPGTISNGKPRRSSTSSGIRETQIHESRLRYAASDEERNITRTLRHEYLMAEIL